jgi:cytochrome c oxidase subunit 3
MSAPAILPPPSADTQRNYQTRLGMWVFLSTELMFFGPVFWSYLVARQHAPAAFAQAGRLTNAWLGTGNTLLLLTSSLTMALAVEAARHGVRSYARRALWLTALLGCVFLAVKGYEYVNDWHENLFPGAHFHALGIAGQDAAQMFFFVYFFATGLHALHLTIGIVMVAVMIRRMRTAARSVASREVDLVGLYWHFVDIVWIFLFPALYLIGRSS